MSETVNTPEGRGWARYDSDDPARVSLPGYLAADPSYVEPGDVFSFDAAFSEQLSTGRFALVDEPEVTSPNASLTKAQLAEKIVDAGIAAGGTIPEGTSRDELIEQAVRESTKDELVALADATEALNPTPPDAVEGDTETEGSER